HPEVIHRQALRRAPVDAEAAADAAALVDDHGGRVRAQLAARHLREVDVAVDAVDALRRDHLDAVVRADIGAAVAEDAAVAVDEDIELALKAALRFLEADALGVAHLRLERVVHGLEATLRDRKHRHVLPPDAGVVDAPDEAADHRRHRPFRHALGEQRVRRGDVLGRDAGDLHLLDLRLDAAHLPVDGLGNALAFTDRGDEVGRVDDVVTGGPDVRQLGLQVLVEQRHAPAVHVREEIAEEAVVLLLADRLDHHVTVDNEFGALDWHRATAAGGVRLAQLVADELDATNATLAVVKHAGRGDHVLDLDALDLGFLELELLDRDLVDSTAIGHHRALGAEADNGADAVHRGEATADGDDAAADPDVFLAERDVGEEFEAGDDAVQLVARDAEALGGLASGAQDDDVMRVDDFLELDVLADFGVVVDLHAEVGDKGDFFGDDVTR